MATDEKVIGVVDTCKIAHSEISQTFILTKCVNYRKRTNSTPKTEQVIVGGNTHSITKSTVIKSRDLIMTKHIDYRNLKTHL